MSDNRKGSKEYFDLSWSGRKEAKHNYFTLNEPKTQMQLAFSSHWDLFNRMLLKGKKGVCLETGCGRGNMSLYFADAGWDCHLLDISENALSVARDNFESLGMKGEFQFGDVHQLPYEKESFDCVFSIGLLEHFEDVEQIIEEQHRILKKEGIFIGYVVPERKMNVQTLVKPANILLSKFKKFFDPKVDIFKNDRELLYRSDFTSDHYMKIMKKLGWKESGSFGTFPIPSVSYSEIYPFTPLPEKLERTVVTLQNSFLNLRSRVMEYPWMCSEVWGQAFVVWGVKK